MTDHADLTARLRAWADAWDDLHGDRLATASTIRADGQTHALRSADVRLLLDALDAADAENARLRAERDKALAEVAQLREALDRSAPWLDYLAAHVAVDWSPPEEAVMRRDAEFVRDVLAVSEEATDA